MYCICSDRRSPKTSTAPRPNHLPAVALPQPYPTPSTLSNCFVVWTLLFKWTFFRAFSPDPRSCILWPVMGPIVIVNTPHTVPGQLKGSIPAFGYCARCEFPFLFSVKNCPSPFGTQYFFLDAAPFNDQLSRVLRKPLHPLSPLRPLF
jgi:hypothetical protein